jgi:hypothetical protein
MLIGYIQINQPSGSPSLLWEEIDVGSGSNVRLKNKATGLCIGDSLIPPTKPTACRVVGAAICGLVEFTCDRFSAADSIVVPSGTIGVKVSGVQPQIGLIIATYLNQGAALVSVCAQKSGMTACGDPFDVSFGPIVCAGPSPGTHTCPTGQIVCRGACSPPSNPECYPQ